MIWNFSQSADAAGKPSATLTFQVPETDEIKVYATCGQDVPEGVSHYFIATNFGSLKPGADTSIRFSGNGREYQISGTVAIPAGGEGIYGVRLTIPHGHEIWSVFSDNGSLDYQIPGFSSDRLSLKDTGQAARNYIAACRAIVSDEAKTTNSGQISEGGLTEREAFTAAKDLDSADAWRAFLKIHPQGFFADLAHGYLAKNQPKPEPQIANLPFYNSAAGYTPWYNFTDVNEETNDKEYAAGVKAGGLELIATCSSDKTLSLLIRENNGQYPEFSKRTEQGFKQTNIADFNFGAAGFHRLPLVVFGLTGDVGTINGIAPNGRIISAMMKGNRVQINRPPFGATFQLKNSRRALCKVINRCGAIVSQCQPKTRPVTSRNPISNAGRCRARSVWVNGRGCILRKHANTRNKQLRRQPNGCRRGQIRFAGRCMYPRQTRGFCGPGFTPRGSKCVHNSNLRNRVKRRVSEAYCNAQGLIKEGNYCVEDD